MDKGLRFFITVFLIFLIIGLFSIYVDGPAGRETSGNISVETVAEDLEIPWDIVFLPDGDILVTERPGRLVRIGENLSVHEVEGVAHRGEGGLLGLALHPEFDDNGLLYLYMTTETDGGITNRVVRYRYSEDELSEPETIISGIPGASYHDGGRIKFGPEGLLYITTGDAGDAMSAQDRESLAGKILRLEPDGSVPEENPFGTPVYSYGHRNPQGITWDEEGNLWSTEHGRSGARSGLDELNRIEKGGNYGWPVIQGDETQEGMVTPELHSGSETTWAPASAEYHNGTIFFGGLRGSSVYQAVLGESIVLKKYFEDRFGRIRKVKVHGEYLYFTTSNRDGRGTPKDSDDRLIRVPLDYFS